MDEPRSSSAPAPDTASSPAPPDAQQISSDPEPDADDWDVEPGSRKGDSGTVASGVAAPAAQGGGGTVDEDELDDLKRIEEQSRNLELSLSWEDVDEELREFLASGDEEEEDEDEDGDGDGDADGDDASNSKGGMSHRSSENTGEQDRRAGDGSARYAVFIPFRRQRILLRPPHHSQSGPSTPRMRRKRLRSLTPSEAGLNSSDDDLLRSPLSKRKRLAKERQNASRLKESIISPEEFGQYALPTVPSPREEDEEDGDEEEESIFGDDDDDDFLARELEEEMG
jgi:RNA polymerase II subunit A-like phosphatase